MFCQQKHNTGVCFHHECDSDENCRDRQEEIFRSYEDIMRMIVVINTFRSSQNKQWNYIWQWRRERLANCPPCWIGRLTLLLFRRQGRWLSNSKSSSLSPSLPWWFALRPDFVDRFGLFSWIRLYVILPSLPIYQSISRTSYCSLHILHFLEKLTVQSMAIIHSSLKRFIISSIQVSND